MKLGSFSWLLWLFSLVLLNAQPRNAELHKLFADYWEQTLRLSPELATDVGRHEYNGRWTDYSAAGLEARRKLYEETRRRLQAFQPAQLNRQDRLSHQLLDQQLQVSLTGFSLDTLYFSVNHFFAPHLEVSSTLAKSPAATVKDYENLIARLNALPALSSQLTELADQARQKGLIQPKRVTELMLRQLEMQAAVEPAKSPLLAAFFRFPASIPPQEQTRLKDAATKAYTTQFQPAWKTWRAALAKTYLPAARESIGMKDIFNGPESYEFLVRRETTTAYKPQAIHEIGLKEVNRIKSEMESIRKELKFTGGHAEFQAAVLDAPAFMFKTEREILMHGRDIAKRIDPELPRLFRKLPRMPYGVRAIPADRARTSAPYYEGPALDGTRAGNFHLRTVDPEKQSKCCLQSLIIHESVPGHHLQVALSTELEDVPEFRKTSGFTAYVEGWALYAETLGTALGMYETPYERYGALQSEIMRATRLVVDTGMHALGWSRDKAIEFMRASGAYAPDDFLLSEVDRYIAIPGQALAYKVGALKIQELRSAAERELGSKFDVREFHDVVLGNGALPLDLLERQVMEYIAEARKRL